MRSSPLHIGLVLVLIGGGASAHAEELSSEPAVKSPLMTLPSTHVPVKTAKRGKRREQKETEGTEAPERFEADTILKSPYSVEGQPLEVDPD